MNTNQLPALNAMFRALDALKADAPATTDAVADLLAYASARFTDAIGRARQATDLPRLDLEVPGLDPVLLREAADEVDAGLHDGDSRAAVWIQARLRPGALDALVLAAFDAGVLWGRLLRNAGLTAQGKRPAFPTTRIQVDAHADAILALLPA